MKTKANRNIKKLSWYLGHCCYYNGYDYVEIKQERWYKILEYKGCQAVNFKWTSSEKNRMSYACCNNFNAWGLNIKLPNGDNIHSGYASRYTKGKLKKMINDMIATKGEYKW